MMQRKCWVKCNKEHMSKNIKLIITFDVLLFVDVVMGVDGAMDVVVVVTDDDDNAGGSDKSNHALSGGKWLIKSKSPESMDEASVDQGNDYSSINNCFLHTVW